MPDPAQFSLVHVAYPKYLEQMAKLLLLLFLLKRKISYLQKRSPIKDFFNDKKGIYFILFFIFIFIEEKEKWVFTKKVTLKDFYNDKQGNL